MSIIMDVEKIVSDWLSKSKYDGLFNEERCACLKDDLAPCGEIQIDCIAGYKMPCDGTCAGGKCDFHIGLDKPTEPTNDQATESEDGG